MLDDFACKKKVTHSTIMGIAIVFPLSSNTETDW